MGVKLCLTLREEQRLRVFENRVLRRIFGPKRDEVTGECRRVHNEELYDLYATASNRGVSGRKFLTSKALISPPPPPPIRSLKVVDVIFFHPVHVNACMFIFISLSH
jgi:hypothetical protein